MIFTAYELNFRDSRRSFKSPYFSRKKITYISFIIKLGFVYVNIVTVCFSENIEFWVMYIQFYSKPYKKALKICDPLCLQTYFYFIIISYRSPTIYSNKNLKDVKLSIIIIDFWAIYFHVKQYENITTTFS